MTDALRERVDAIGKCCRTPAPVGDVPAELHHGRLVRPLHALARRDVLSLRRFHQRGDRLADFDRVVPQVVGDIDHVGDGFDIVVAAVRAERPCWLVLDRLHLHLVRAAGDFDLFLAGHGAGVTGRVVDQVVLLHVLAAQLFGAVSEVGLLAVTRTEAADGVRDVHQHVRAVERETTLLGRGDR